MNQKSMPSNEASEQSQMEVKILTRKEQEANEKQMKTPKHNLIDNDECMDDIGNLFEELDTNDIKPIHTVEIPFGEYRLPLRPFLDNFELGNKIFPIGSKFEISTKLIKKIPCVYAGKDLLFILSNVDKDGIHTYECYDPYSNINYITKIKTKQTLNIHESYYNASLINKERKKFQKKVYTMKKKGINIVQERLLIIDDEISRISYIKKYFEENINQNTLNCKHKHINDNTDFYNTEKGQENGTNYGLFLLRFVEHDDMLNSVNNSKYNIKIKKQNINMLGNSDYVVELIYKYIFVRILTELELYANYLNEAKNNIKRAKFNMHDIFCFNNIIENKVVKIDETNKHMINLEDYYDEIYVVKDYYIIGMVRNKDIFSMCNCYIICHSKQDRGSKWNIFPGAYDDIGKIRIIKSDKIKDCIQEMRDESS
jgi:hypothetical protein